MACTSEHQARGGRPHDPWVTIPMVAVPGVTIPMVAGPVVAVPVTDPMVAIPVTLWWPFPG